MNEARKDMTGTSERITLQLLSFCERHLASIADSLLHLSRAEREKEKKREQEELELRNSDVFESYYERQADAFLESLELDLGEDWVEP
jgi:hypothetical protein